MSIQSVLQGTFSFFHNLPIVVEATALHLTSDAGLLPICEFDEHIGLTGSFAGALNDPRTQGELAKSCLNYRGGID